MSQYIIGIDLGTTNIAVSYLNAEEAEEAVPELFAIIQITDQGERDKRATLPSFLYLPDDKEVSKKALDLPWAAERDYCVGAFARKNAQLLPGKVISSAKSWLCAQNVDSDSKILPWNHEDPSRKISPVTATQRFLEHLRDAWNDSIGADNAKAKFQKQDIVLTVPASFDAVARDMTMQAAKKARLEVTLLEEPQAAFYAWLQAHNENWRDRVAAGELILVCDIGGGTTDFSLIKVTDEGGDLDLQRVAVGNHILLGGDNMDLAMAYGVAARLLEEKGVKLDQYQIAGLTHACREAKEVLCADANAKPQKLTVLGRGSSVVGGTITTEVTIEQMQESLVDGFFPLCNIDDSPQQSTKAGLRTFGLDYEADPAVTKHLAAFLSRHGDELPGAILFNGGVTKANALTSRIVETINGWRGKKDLTVLDGTDADLAVAHGACWYGNVRQGNAIRIRAGSAHSYYVAIESSMPAVPGISPPVAALCVVQFGMEEGTSQEIPYSGLGLVVGETTDFKFFGSADRTEDNAGEILQDVNRDDLHNLPSLSAKLPVEDKNTPAGTLVPVRLRAVLSEIGTLQLWCLEEGGSKREWKLEYEIRSAEPANDEDEEAKE
jgi:molecular chaperone DnaK (HSP70)